MTEIIKIMAIASPVAYLLHCLEEFLVPGGFVTWYHRFRPALNKQSSGYYWRVNIIAFIIVAVTGFYAYFTNNNNSGLIISSSFLASNALFTHVFGAIKTHKYSLGMFTGVCLYIPICIICYVVAFSNHLINDNMLVIYIIIGQLYELWNYSKYKRLVRFK